MPQDHRQIPEALLSRLELIEAGLYTLPARSPWGQPPVFQDFLICLNYGDDSKNQPCKMCALGLFGPLAHLSKAGPRHHLPLSKAGDTIDQLEWKVGHQEIEERVKTWLQATITQFEEEAGQDRTSGRPKELAACS